MKDKSSFIKKLKNLYDENMIIMSKFSKGELSLLKQKLDDGSMIFTSMNGRSKVIRVMSSKFLIEFIKNKERELNEREIKIGVGQRSNNIAQGGYSKKGDSRIRNKPIFLRGFNGCKIRSHNGEFLDVSENTKTFGSSAVTFKNPLELVCKSRPIIVFVENLESFMHSEIIFKDADLLLWYSGNIDHELYEIFTHSGFCNAEVIVFADYDVIGLRNYFRIKEKLKDIRVPVSFYTPENICNLIIETKNKTDKRLLNDQQFSKYILELSEKSRNDSNPMIIKILEAMKKTGNGFEQEGLFVKNKCDNITN